jgi:ABC-type cobalamin/Fe3+-siderophores transport system ATPase subunit
LDAITLRDVTKQFGDFLAVRNLSFEVPQGSIFGLLGPNGAGKTTTIRMIINIIAPDSGEILLFGAFGDSLFHAGNDGTSDGSIFTASLADTSVYVSAGSVDRGSHLGCRQNISHGNSDLRQETGSTRNSSLAALCLKTEKMKACFEKDRTVPYLLNERS